MHLSLKDVEEAIQEFPPEQQQLLLAELPRLLQIPRGELSYLKLAEPSFEFWENPDDSIYDTM